MKKERLAYLYILICGILWGFIGVFVRILASYGLSTMQIVISRFIMVSITFGAYIFFTGKHRFFIKKEDVKYFIIFGIACFLVYNVTFALTTRLTSLSVAVALLYTSPIWAMLFSIPVFKEKLTKKKALAIILSFTGCSLISGIFSGQAASITPLSLFTGVVSGIGYGSYGVFAKKLLQKYDAMTTTFYPFVFASVGGIFLCDMAGMAKLIAQSPILILYIFLGALVCFVIPYGLYTYSLNFVEASRAAVIVSIEPVSATVLGLVIYSEHVTASIIIGMLCVLSAIFILNMKGKKEEANAEEVLYETGEAG